MTVVTDRAVYGPSYPPSTPSMDLANRLLAASACLNIQSSRNGGFVVNGQPLEGIHSAVDRVVARRRERWTQRRKNHRRPRVQSLRARRLQGCRVHADLAHWANNGTIRPDANAYTRKLLRVLSAQRMRPVRAELPACLAGRCATRIDLVCVHRGTNRLYVFEVKTSGLRANEVVRDLDTLPAAGNPYYVQLALVTAMVREMLPAGSVFESRLLVVTRDNKIVCRGSMCPTGSATELL